MRLYHALTRCRPAPSRPPRHAAVAMAGLLLAACSDYEFRVNDRLVYTPAPLFGDFRTEDGALFDCLAQTISDQKVVQAGALTALRCSHAGIRSLAGLETFQGLEFIDASHNALSAVGALAALPALLEADLSFNELADVSALEDMPWLERIDLRGNPLLLCGPARRLAARPRTRVQLPEHCSGQR